MWAPPVDPGVWPPEWGESPEGPTRWVSPSALSQRGIEEAARLVRKRGRPPNPPLSVRHLERFELGTRYPEVVGRVGELVETPPLKGRSSVLLVDKTGVGAGVVDHLAQAGLRPNAVTIHGGSTVSRDPQRPGLRVPERDLVCAVQVLQQTGRLKIAKGLAEAETLRRELLNFRIKIDPKTAHDSYEHWREGKHDDLVLATAMACWFREWWHGRREIGLAGMAAREGGRMDRF